MPLLITVYTLYTVVPQDKHLHQSSIPSWMSIRPCHSQQSKQVCEYITAAIQFDIICKTVGRFCLYNRRLSPLCSLYIIYMCALIPWLIPPATVILYCIHVHMVLSLTGSHVTRATVVFYHKGTALCVPCLCLSAVT